MTRQFLLIFLNIGLVFGCASTEATNPRELRGAAKFAGDPRLGEKVNHFCFTGSINGFAPNDDDTILVRARANQQYLIETQSFCPDLDFAQSVAFDTRSSCISRGDRLLVSTSAFSLNDGGIGPDTCLITGIYEWDKDAELEDEEAKEEPSS